MSTPEQLLDALIEVGFLRADDGAIDFRHAWIQNYLNGATIKPDSLDKYIIGLTGNIAVGKTTVLGVLEALGAQIINADRLVHQLREPEAPGFQPVVDLLSRDVLDDNGRINTAELSRRAFADQHILRQLELIFHPLVREEVERLVASSPQRVAVIEAIKLLEGQLKERVHAVWVVHASRQAQIERLVRMRHLTHQEAVRRVDAQNPQQEKLSQADVVIENDGDIAITHRQVIKAWLGVLNSMDQTSVLDDRFIAQLLVFCGEHQIFAAEASGFIEGLKRLAQRVITGKLSREQAAVLLRVE